MELKSVVAFSVILNIILVLTLLFLAFNTIKINELSPNVSDLADCNTRLHSLNSIGQTCVNQLTTLTKEQWTCGYLKDSNTSICYVVKV